MNREEILTWITKDQIIKKLLIKNRIMYEDTTLLDDLEQEIILVLAELKPERLIKMEKEKKVINYILTLIFNNVKSSNSEFFWYSAFNRKYFPGQKRKTINITEINEDEITYENI